MCGIAGLWNAPVGRAEVAALMREMLRALAHRGPDDERTFEDANAGLVLGHRRLAVIDPSPAAAQPMTDASGRFSIILNGEIYNFRELREELARAGAAFRTQSDTEVLLAAYERWGPDMLDRLVGMYALALWDARAGELFLARDRAGEKPLYYTDAGGGFAFASEIRALAALPWVPREVDREAVALYLAYQYVPAPHSIYRAVRKLPPGHAMLVRRGDRSIRRYWDPTEHARAPRLALREPEALERLTALLADAVRGQMIADVPLGAFLSGGVDSSLIASFMGEVGGGPVQTFTIGFDVPRFDESRHAARVAAHLGVEHHVQHLTERDALEIVPRLPSMYGEPFADSSAVPTHLVSRVARQRVTVSLSGDGGDEAFGGYPRFTWLERLSPWLRAAAPMRAIGLQLAPHLPAQAARVAPLVGCRPRDVYRGLVSIFLPEEITVLAGSPGTLVEFERAWAANGGTYSLAARARLADLLTYLPEAILVKVDRAAMAVSLETRAPFLDHRVLEFALRLPEPLLREKRLLRRLLYRRVPRALVDRPKRGFGVPLARWLRGPLRDLVLESVTPATLEPLGIEDGALVRRLRDEHLSGERDRATRLWALLMLALWEKTRHE